VTARAGEAYAPFVADWSLTKVLIPLGHAMSAYFRARMHGTDRIPRDVPVIFVGKHPRSFLYFETLVLGTHVWWDRAGRPLRVLESRGTALHRTPVIGWMRRHVNAVAASAALAREALQQGESILIFPGGTRELYGEPDRLRWDGRDGFARLAIETQAPIVPFAIIGADRQHPFRLRLRDSSVWLPPFPLPVRLDYYFGDPIAAPSPNGGDARDHAARVERTTQALIDDGLAARRRRSATQ
jgi:1-acyl-sn-glycerol-3-phosphate acyltransferase